MKVIDLLNKIAKGEEVPKKIKYLDKLWFYDDNDYVNCDMTMCLFGDYIDKNYYIIEVLNDEVEIIEEDKKIEKFVFGEIEDEEHFNMKLKINKLIDEVNKLKEDK